MFKCFSCFFPVGSKLDLLPVGHINLTKSIQELLSKAKTYPEPDIIAALAQKQFNLKERINPYMLYLLCFNSPYYDSLTIMQNKIKKMYPCLQEHAKFLKEHIDYENFSMINIIYVYEKHLETYEYILKHLDAIDGPHFARSYLEFLTNLLINPEAADLLPSTSKGYQLGQTIIRFCPALYGEESTQKALRLFVNYLITYAAKMEGLIPEKMTMVTKDFSSYPFLALIDTYNGTQAQEDFRKELSFLV